MWWQIQPLDKDNSAAVLLVNDVCVCGRFHAFFYWLQFASNELHKSEFMIFHSHLRYIKRRSMIYVINSIECVINCSCRQRLETDWSAVHIKYRTFLWCTRRVHGLISYPTPMIQISFIISERIPAMHRYGSFEYFPAKISKNFELAGSKKWPHQTICILIEVAHQQTNKLWTFTPRIYFNDHR